MTDATLSTLLDEIGVPRDGWLGKYELRALLGQGGMGIVIEAFDERLQREVALKFLSPTLASHATARERFLAEARAVANLRHENIVSVFDVNEEFNLPFLAMERLHGESLLKLLKQDFPFTDQQAFRIASQVAAGLAAAHCQHIVHRDVKPANVFLELPAGKIKLLDFGLARSLFSKEGNAVLLGTPGYMAPEQARDEPADHRSDIYAVGVLLYRLLAGKLPLGDHDSATLLARLLTEDSPSLQRSRPDLPGSLITLVDRCLARKPEDRPREMSELQKQLDKLQVENTDSLKIQSSTQKSTKARSFNRFVGLTLASLFLATAMWGILFSGPWWIDKSPPSPASLEPDPFAEIGASPPRRISSPATN